ncbi:MAG: hypothetical protein KF914_11400 [Rhizobiaceae bacterium]|nr:hypothetical protein [Rhizobiaceae bacterium]
MPVVSDYTGILSGASWSGVDDPNNSPTFVTFSFESVLQPYVTTSLFTQAFLDSMRSFTEAEKTAARAALAQWADASGLVLLEVQPGEGDIRFGSYDFNLDPNTKGFTGQGYRPYSYVEEWFAHRDLLGGDVFIDYGDATATSLLLHEIGHALGFKHPFEGDTTLDAAHDDQSFTVMSYNGAPSSVLSPFDVEAVQHVYGLNTADGAQVFSWSWNAADRILTQVGYSSGDTIFGTSVTDIVDGGDGSDWLGGFQGNDQLSGGDGDDRLFGGDGDDTLTGGAGIDTYFGGTGDDTYVITDADDYWIYEYAGEGSKDTVLASLTYDLLAGMDIEKLATTDETATTKINLYGNEIAQEIIGNAGANLISDGGKGGADVLKGLGGDDTYRVYNSGDTIIEGAAEGANDTVLVNVSFDLLEDIHIETFGTLDAASTRTINLYGNRLAQEITGNAGRNIISDGGKGAADVLKGLAGNDTYRVYNSGTVVVEGAGQGLSDTVQAAVSYTLKAGVEVEVLTTTSASGKSAISLYGNELDQTITGNAGANALRGYDGDDTINGGAGDDRISGGLGNDTLAGNAGADTYYFSYALDEATNVDTIKGFSGIDLISLNASIFAQAGPAGALAAAAFAASADGNATTAAHRITYETDTGILRYDADGTGAAAAVAFAIMQGLPSMNAGDFVIA